LHHLLLVGAAHHEGPSFFLVKLNQNLTRNNPVQLVAFGQEGPLTASFGLASNRRTRQGLKDEPDSHELQLAAALRSLDKALATNWRQHISLRLVSFVVLISRQPKAVMQVFEPTMAPHVNRYEGCS
jgi:hypothetical protein